MKQVHNVRIRIHDAEAERVGRLFAQLMKDASITHEDVAVSVQYDGESGLHLGELWADHQQPVRRILSVLVQEIPDHQREHIAAEPSKYLDTGTHFFLRLSKDHLQRGEYHVLPEGECVHVRLNIAAFPANKENAATIVQQLFARD